ncbi:hypothetical protein HYPSUDRAFT_197184 [Hypholoma sublateritium FD-334 SS-4]|uniref:Uncharacterized protein n=1 Tax=Hypholoma sublateritium (strain FD-334 SS-4) TaxID=945553 RepID=A0A0D2MWC0_HYPSF|nr:hypothetical protein HYPSUDRAFT_197184 [Hypholoma sublateritium FD-334 SS-4]
MKHKLRSSHRRCSVFQTLHVRFKPRVLRLSCPGRRSYNPVCDSQEMHDSQFVSRRSAPPPPPPPRTRCETCFRVIAHVPRRRCSVHPSAFPALTERETTAAKFVLRGSANPTAAQIQVPNPQAQFFGRRPAVPPTIRRRRYGLHTGAVCAGSPCVPASCAAAQAPPPALIVALTLIPACSAPARAGSVPLWSARPHLRELHAPPLAPNLTAPRLHTTRPS